MKKAFSLLCALALALSLAACGGDSSSSASQPAASGSGSASVPSSSSQAASVSAPAAAKPTEDRAGNPITVPDEVNTIVSLAASTTRILDDLGLAGKLVAVDMYSEPNLSAGLPEGLLVLDMTAPDMEQLAALQPDIIFVSPISSGGGDDVFAPLREAGVCVAEIPTPDTVAGVLEDVQFIADCAGESAKGQQLVDEAQATLDEVAAKVAGAGEKPLVYFEVSPAPYLYSTGGGTYLNEMMELAGGTNLFADQDSWVSITEEAVIAGQPQVIFTGVSYLEDAVGEITARPGWENLPAVQDGKVYYIDTRDSQEPTHHVAAAIRAMAEYLHPELF